MRHTPPSRGESLDHDIHMAFEEEIGDSPPSLLLSVDICCGASASWALKSWAWVVFDEDGKYVWAEILQLPRY